MRPLLLMMLAIVCVLGCAPHRAADLEPPGRPIFVDAGQRDVEGMIVPEEQIDASVYDSRFEPRWTPSSDDIHRLESGLREGLIASQARPAIYDRLSGYRRQYVGVIVDGHRRILVNAFWGIGPDGKDWHPDWKQRFVFVLDGGHHYWQVQFDMDSNTYVGFEQNGYG